MTTGMHLAVALVAGHLLADFVSQSQEFAREKAGRPWLLAAHAAVAGLLPFLLVGTWSLWEIPVVTALTHALFDFLKLKSRKQTLTVFAVDQLAHLMVIGVLVQWIDVAPSVLRWVTRYGEGFSSVLIVISGAIAATTVSAVVVGYIVKDLQKNLYDAKDEPFLDEDGVNDGFPSGGAIIGRLERLLVFILVLVNQPQALGFLIAAKSILRFGELREDRQEAEYVIIGTMWSLVCGLLVTLATRAALTS